MLRISMRMCIRKCYAHARYAHFNPRKLMLSRTISHGRLARQTVGHGFACFVIGHAFNASRLAEILLQLHILIRIILSACLYVQLLLMLRHRAARMLDGRHERLGRCIQRVLCIVYRHYPARMRA